MHLLKRETSNQFSLVEFAEDQIPRYAILSHRWGKDEVLFQDIIKGVANTKAGGYEKLVFCANQAACDKLQYFWVDTCCFNKESSAEESKAINSMFKWYQNATKCYVYLSDVPSGPGWEVAFQQSIWFTRGWTLQELIAPNVVEFFSTDGKKLGDKQSLEQHIHLASGVSIEALRGKPLAQISETERFSWTAKRKTTIEEDAVYCLLGIFDVSMTVIHGEGRQRALGRLQQKIRLAANPDMFTFKNVAWVVPFERNGIFTGREEQLVELEGKLFTGTQTSKIAITGLGGVGKTQLVLELLYRTKRQHPACSIMWIPAVTLDTLYQGYATVAQQLNIPDYNNEKADMIQLVQGYLSRGEAGQWLLVFDNADDIDMWMATQPVPQSRLRAQGLRETHSPSSAQSQRLLDYLPRHERGCIIFTTRNRKAAVKFAPGNVMTVSEMSEDIATELLKKSLNDKDLINHKEDTSKLLAALTYLPLAITQAAAYIDANSLTLADYLSLLDDTKEEEVIDILSEDFEAGGRYQNLKNPVATTWLISFEQIRLSDPLAAEYLSFIACISHKEIPQSLLPPGPSRKKELDAIGTLVAYSFVSRSAIGNALNMHRLAHISMRNWLRKERTLSKCTEGAITHLAEVFPGGNHQNRSIWRSYLPHAMYILTSDIVSEDRESTIELTWRCGRCLYRDGRWDEAEARFIKVLEIRPPGEEVGHGDCYMDWLASTYWNQGRWEEAEQLQVQVMERRKTKLGADHLDTLRSMNNLASTYSDQGRWEEAEQLKVQVMERRKTTLGADHPDTLTSISNLASTYSKQGRWEEAEQLQVQVMERTKTKLGADHPDTLRSMNNLAHTWKSMNRYVDAVRLMQDCVQRSMRVIGADHPNIKTSINTLSRWQSEDPGLGTAL